MHNAFFEGLIFTEDDQPVEVTYLGVEAHYVLDDQGFRRHVPARELDRAVLEQFKGTLDEHRDLAAQAVLAQLGRDDLFTKAAVDHSLRNLDLDQVLDQGLPGQARTYLGMLGFRVVVDYHGDVVKVEMPQAPADWDSE